MTDATITLKQELLEQVRKLDHNQQRRVVAYARARHTRPKGISGKQAVRIAREIAFDPAELALMQQNIKEEFEQVSDLPEAGFNA